MPHTGLITIQTEVPFGASIRRWLELDATQSLDALIASSRGYEQAYHSWEEVRRGRNPFFTNGTGFEGYFVGVCCSPDETLARLLDVGTAMITNILRFHPHEKRFRARLLQTIDQNVYDWTAMTEWAVELGVALARLRTNLFHNPAGVILQTETNRMVMSLPWIAYGNDNGSLFQRYGIVTVPAKSPRVDVDPQQLKPDQQEAWLVMQNVGKFGHPLLRAYMSAKEGWWMPSMLDRQFD
jgi:hypothetical protein